MSKTVLISSTSQFSSLLSSSTIVVADFYADWCGPCRQIAPIYEELSSQLSIPNKITFTKINTDHQVELARSYGVRAMPTFMIFKNARKVEGIEGADPRRLSSAVKKLAEEANKLGTDGEASGSNNGSGGTWLGSTLPKGFMDITSQVDSTGLELLNFDSKSAGPRLLFTESKPSGLSKIKSDTKPDYVESDTDEQLMLYVPFQSTLKIHSLHITSLPPTTTSDDDDDDRDEDELPSRPKTIKLYTNKSHILGFDDADDTPATQEITLNEKDWDSRTGTAKVELRYVKFQNVSSLVIFVVESEGDNEKVRIDRLRFIGESGEKRDGKIEKIASDD